MLTWWRALLDIVYPPKCPACRRPVEDHGDFCSSCLASVLAGRDIDLAAHHLTWLDSCRVVCDYGGGVQRLMRGLKFQRIKRYAVPLGRLLQAHVGRENFPPLECVVPVPLHAGRLVKRGYNQTELIFRLWATGQGLVWRDALVRQRTTAAQWRLGLAERRKNIKGAFAVTRPEWVEGRQVLLVDDIFTTGITMNECARTLKKAGAVAVYGLALASGAQ